MHRGGRNFKLVSAESGFTGLIFAEELSGEKKLFVLYLISQMILLIMQNQLELLEPVKNDPEN